MPELTLNVFSGSGGWCVAAAELGIERNVGLELDAAACATRRAAGHLTVRCDVAAFDTARLTGQVRGLVGSPPCTTFSAAGKRAGTGVTDILDALIRDMLEGLATRAAHRREMARMLALSWWPSPKLTRVQRSAKIWQAVRSASLVAEAARFIHACDPEWVALEQVPSVLPLWQVYAEELRARGYSAWTGILNAANYGVPQVRNRAILIASKARRVGRPPATHYDPRRGFQLFGSPWITMADALGWGMSERPYFTLATAGGNRGGADEQVGGSGARKALYAERDGGRWMVRTSFGEPAAGPKADGHGSHGTHEMDPFGQPAHAVTGKTKDWVLHTNRDQRPDGSRQTADPFAAPAPSLTAKPGGQWEVRPGWVNERPATTVLGEPRMGRPDAVRLTVAEAAVLQSFAADYPFQGSVTAQFQQVGNSFPPLCAIHVLAMATGRPLPAWIEAAA